jgi:hypothetical protein
MALIKLEDLQIATSDIVDPLTLAIVHGGSGKEYYSYGGKGKGEYEEEKEKKKKYEYGYKKYEYGYEKYEYGYDD